MPVLPDVGSIRTVFPGWNLSFALHQLDHVEADAVFYAGNRIKKLKLCQQIGPNPVHAGKLVEANYGRISNRLRDRIVNAASAWGAIMPPTQHTLIH